MINELHWSDSGDSSFDERLRAVLRVDGYAVVRGLFDDVEVAKLRAVVDGHLRAAGARYQLGRTQPNAAAYVPDLAFVFAHPDVVRLFRGLLGEGSTVFTRHCDIHKNMVSGWHKDSGETVEGGYFKGDYFGSDECQVFKLAVYLQDSTPRSGLTLVPKSHRQPQTEPAGGVQLPTRLGDCVVFDVRITHTGQRPDVVEKALRALSALANRGTGRQDPESLTRLHDLYWRLLRRADRESVFFTFGLANDFTFDFAEANLDRQARQGSDDSASDDRQLAALASALSDLGVLTYGVNVGDLPS